MQPCFLLSEVQHVNHIDRSFGVVFARRWRLGIYALARVASGEVRTERFFLLGWVESPLLSRQEFTIKEKTNESEHER
jgi:hypothetical protein